MVQGTKRDKAMSNAMRPKLVLRNSYPPFRLLFSHACRALVVTKTQINLNSEATSLRAAITHEDVNQMYTLSTEEAKQINLRFRERVQGSRAKL